MKALSGFYYVDDGECVTACRGRGRLRHEKNPPLVGDRVRFTHLGNGQGSLDEILPRRNQFYRPAVANVDQLCIVISPQNPKADLLMVEKLIFTAMKEGAAVLLCGGAKNQQLLL